MLYFRSNIKKLVVCLIAVFFAAYGAVASNLLQNPGFEELDSNGKPAGWSLWSGPDDITLTDLSFTGEKAVMAQVKERVNWRISQDIPSAQPGKYELTFHAKIVGDAWIRAIWVFEDADGAPIKSGANWSKTLTQAANWTMVQTMIEAPAGVAKMTVRFNLGLEKNGDNGLVFLDNVGLTALSVKDVQSDALPVGAKLVMEEDFSSEQLPPEWKIISGDWKVADDALHGGGNGLIFYTVAVGSPNMRIEYTAWADDEPADLSAVLSQSVESEKINGYFFGFGCQRNTVNKILRGSERKMLAEQGGALEVFEHPIQPGVKHKIVAQRNYNELKLFVDGKLVLEGNDPFFGNITGEGFGFFIWSRGCMDDVKIYALPWQGGGLAGERAVEFQMHEGFEKFPAGEGAGGFQTDSGHPGLRVVDRPTWIYKHPMGNEFVPDNCLEIVTPAPGEKIKLSRSFDPLKSGIIEFDILAEEHKEFKFAVTDARGKDILNLIIAADGQFMTEDEKGRRVIRDTIRYQRRVFDAKFRFMPNRWYTFRLQFTEGLKQIVLLNHYSELEGSFTLGMAGEYLPLDCAVAPSAGIEAVSFSVDAEGAARLYLDNLVVFGPIGTDTVGGKPLTLSAAQLLELDFPPRKDPFSLKLQTFRHLWARTGRFTPLWRAHDKAPKYKYFRPAANDYNQALVDLAFMEEKINMLRRAAFYAGSSELAGELAGKLAGIGRMHADAEDLQEQALQAFAVAHLSGQDETKLDGFYAVTENIHAKHAEINAMMEDCLQILKPGAAVKDIVSCPAPIPDGEIIWNSARKRWERNGEPVVYDYFSHASAPPQYTNDLRLLGFPKYNAQARGYLTFPTPGGGDQKHIADGQYVENEDGRTIKWLKRLDENKTPGFIKLQAGFNYACMFAPEWWIEKHKDDPDIFICQPDGSALRDPPWNSQYFLNYWNPDVRDLIDAQFKAIGRLAQEHKSVVEFFQYGAEIKNKSPSGRPGYNQSAIHAFRDMLREKYRTIENLNRLWNAEYKNFDAIVPSVGITPSGLQYEFVKFVHEGFNNWLKSIGDAVHYYAPEIPTVMDTQYTFGGRAWGEALEMIGFFRAADVKLYHSYQAWDRKFVDRWHHQVASALNMPWGTMEWIISQGCPYMFQLERIRNNGLREKAMNMIWGATMIEQWHAASFGNWQYQMNLHNPALDCILLNYSATFASVAMERTRRLGRVALTVPAAKPEIGVLETTDSYYNGLDVREGMRAIAVELTELGWNFEFLYEQLLRENLQHLEGTELLFVPSGLCMNDELADALYAWVAAGGVMFCVGGPAGIWNEYGRPGDRLEDIFKVAWTNTDGRWDLPGVEAFYEGAGVKAWRADHGKGRVIVFDNLNKSVFELMPQFAERRFGCDNPAIQFCMREGDGVKYLYALNWSVDETAEAVVFLKGHFDSIVDEGLQLPMEVPHYKEGGRTFFKTRLAPSAVTLFRIKE